MMVYMYVDTDNNDFRVFKSMAAAQKYARDAWGEESVNEDSEGNDNHWSCCDYVHVYKRKVKG